MREILQQLATLGPGLAAGLKGNGNAMKEFMDAYQRTTAQLEEQRRMQQQTQIQGEDRQLALADRERGIARQGEADARATEDQGWQNQQRLLSLSQLLNQAPANAETLPEAEGAVDSTFGLMTPEQQTTLAPSRDRAIVGAQRMISKKHKDRVEAYIARWENSRLGQENKDADPEMIDLPEDIASLIGKPAAKYSELQQFAKLPVGRAAGKERMPPAAGSMEEFSDPNITPERKAQILADRKAYMQSDDRAPRVTVNTGGVDPKAMARFNAIAGAYDRSPLIRAADRTLPLDDAAKTIRKDPSNAAAQMALAYGFIQALDTYQSAVREGELGNLGSLGTVWQQLGVSANKLIATGAFMPPDVALQIANSADQLVRVIERGRQQKMGEFASRAKVNKVDDMWSEFVAGMPTRATAQTAPPAKGGSGVRVVSITPAKK